MKEAYSTDNGRTVHSSKETNALIDRFTPALLALIGFMIAGLAVRMPVVSLGALAAIVLWGVASHVWQAWQEWKTEEGELDPWWHIGAVLLWLALLAWTVHTATRLPLVLNRPDLFYPRANFVFRCVVLGATVLSMGAVDLLLAVHQRRTSRLRHPWDALIPWGERMWNDRWLFLGIGYLLLATFSIPLLLFEDGLTW